MNPYLAIVAARFRTLLQYRAAALSGAFTQTFFAVVRIMIMEAFYASSAAAPPLARGAMVGYIWLGQATFAMFPWNVDPHVRAAVRSGDVVYELCRPVDQYNLWFSGSLAWRIVPTLLRLVPLLIVATLVLPLVGLGEWRLAPPSDLAAVAAALAAMLGALLLSCALTMLMNISLLWTVSGDGVASLTSGLACLLGGLIIPLPLFPVWAQPILQALPFAGVLDLPARVYTGDIAPADVGWVLGHQVAWIAALVAIGRWALARATRRLVVQGG